MPLRKIKRSLQNRPLWQSKAEPSKGMRRLYRNVFSTREGKLVLTDILNTLGFFDMNNRDEVDLIYADVCKMILLKIGAWQSHNIWGITEAFLRLPDTPTKEKSNE
jgi:hypothetical protein